MSGQSIVDRLNAAKHTVAGSALGRAVVKATTEEVMGPKRKHLDYLLQCTSEINVSIPQMADLLIERTQNTSWVVTFKALITIHHLMCYGNERFSQYMASHNSKFVLNNFMDRSGTQGIDMSSYIRKYAHYLNEKRETYKLMGYDFCKVKRGKDDGMLRTMNTEKLLKTLPILQKQLDALVQFDVQPNELTNAVINTCFVLLSKDLIRLFACYNDGIINLLEKFFDMNKKNCKEALDMYKKFLERTDHVSQFLKVAESSGMDKSEIPDLTKAPGSLLEALEAHVNGGESKKPSGTTATNGSSKPSTAVTNAINSLNGNTAPSLSAEEKRRIVEEEAKALEALKSNHLKKQTSLTSPTSDNIFGISNGTNSSTQKTTTPSSQNDLFGLDLTSPAVNNDANTNGSSASNDLLMLSGPNPFIQNIVNQSYSQQNLAAAAGGAINPFGQQPTGMMMPGASMYQPTNNFVAPINPMFNNNNNQNKLNDLFGGVDFGSSSTNQVKTSNSSSNITANGTTEFDAFGDVLQPTNKAPVLNPTNTKSNSNLLDKNGISAEQKILSTDLDSSLASLANNLDINHKNNNFQKNHQWNSNAQQGQLKTGGQQWKPSTQPTMAPPMSAAWAPTNNIPMGVPANQNWMAAGSNPFATPAPLPMQQPMAAGVNGMQQQKPAVPSANNPFDLF